MLRPDARVDSLSEVTPDLLRSLGARHVLLDLDDTLVASNAEEFVAEAPAAVARLREAGIGVAILSNGKPERVQRASRLLGEIGRASCRESEESAGGAIL